MIVGKINSRAGGRFVHFLSVLVIYDAMDSFHHVMFAAAANAAGNYTLVSVTGLYPAAFPDQ